MPYKHKSRKLIYYLQFREDINAAVERNSALVDHFKRQRREIMRDNVGQRKKRETDCSSICCSNTEQSEPYSHWKDVNGWQEVVNTPEYPQRVTFELATCSRYAKMVLLHQRVHHKN